MIVSVSDTAVGYTAPQIPIFAGALAQYFGEERAIVYEPDNTQRPRSEARWKEFPQVAVTRVPTEHSFYSPEGREVYCRTVADALNASRPDVVIITNVFIASVLLYLDYRPSLVIFQSLELITAYWPNDVAVAKEICNRHLVDLIIFPESNRQRIDIEALGYPDIPQLLMLNSCNPPTSCDQPVPREERIPKVCFTGNFGEPTCFDWFLHPAAKDLAMDWYGWFYEPRDAGRVPANITYLGSLLPGKLREVRSRYAYTLAIWRPNFVNQFYATPNKFFESVADGVPIIVTPHPQCVELIEKYRCGLIIPEFTAESMVETLDTAMQIFETDEYQAMVEGCRRAVREEMNFDVQFKKVTDWIEGRVSKVESSFLLYTRFFGIQILPANHQQRLAATLHARPA